MNVRDLIPWNRNGGNQLPTAFRDGDRDPFLSLHREVNRLFDDVFRGFGLPAVGTVPAFGGGWPSVEISDNEKEIRVTAEVPGLDEKDIEVLLDDGVLTLKGEKRSEVEDKDRQFSERFYGRFERVSRWRRDPRGRGRCAFQERRADRDPAQDGKGAVAGQAHRHQG